MVDVTNTTQLSTFSIIRDILLTNSTISSKFRKSDFHEFEPSLKEHGVNLPYIVINLPSADVDILTSKDNYKSFTVNIVLCVGWEARDKFTDYANALVYQLDNSKSTFKASGYYDPTITLIDSGVEERQSKKVVAGSFRLQMNGVVRR